MPNPKVFISYSWDSNDHKTWVSALAARLRQDGVDAVLDQWHIAPGDQLPEFMERAIRTSAFVLIICTPGYKRHSDCRKGGVGYEGDIITGEVLTKRNHRKFIPLLRAGDWLDAIPSWLVGKYGLDMRDNAVSESEEVYRHLVLTLLGAKEEAPPLGDPPNVKPSNSHASNRVAPLLHKLDEMEAMSPQLARQRFLAEFLEPAFSEFQEIHNWYVEQLRRWHSMLKKSAIDLDTLVDAVNEECVFSTATLSKLRAVSWHGRNTTIDDKTDLDEFFNQEAGLRFFHKIHWYLSVLDDGPEPKYRQRWFRSLSYDLKQIQELAYDQIRTHFLGRSDLVNYERDLPKEPCNKTGWAMFLLASIVQEIEGKFESVCYDFAKLRRRALS